MYWLKQMGKSSLINTHALSEGHIHDTMIAIAAGVTVWESACCWQHCLFSIVDSSCTLTSHTRVAASDPKAGDTALKLLEFLYKSTMIMSVCTWGGGN